MANNNNSNNMFDITSLSTYLGVNPQLIRTLIKDNAIPFFRIGKKYYFRRESIENWLTAKEEQNHSSISEEKITSIK